MKNLVAKYEGEYISYILYNNVMDDRKFLTLKELESAIQSSNGLIFLCGYVGIPKTHPFYGLDYDSEELNDIIIHGGLTFSSRVDKYPDHWILGFDCAHFDDKVYPKSLDFVKQECNNLYRQLVNIK